MKRLPCVMLALVSSSLTATVLADPLPSWNEGDNKSAIMDFVEATTDPASDDFVPQQQRIAVFDNDGTLWSEQPMYFQLSYALQRASEADEEALDTPVKKAAAEGDLKTVMEAGNEGLLEVVSISHSGISVDDFQDDVRDWLASATHPNTDRFYTDMVFQPMLELLSYLRDEGYQTYIVSGGGVDFMRAFASEAYGVPPENIIGSIGDTEVVDNDGELELIKQPGVTFIDDGNGKPLAIQRHIGQRPTIAVGNSDGDVPMLRYTTEADGPRLGVLLHHTDGEREYAYDRDSSFGRLDQGLEQAETDDWTVIDMAQDWRTVYQEAP
ncbi:HAD family hydrolase [Halomonas cupida]|uniref:HAD family hydrolase n=1 Tax=Halomonas cupida TaxID=44933 RepID=UPI003A93E9D0